MEKLKFLFFALFVLLFSCSKEEEKQDELSENEPIVYSFKNKKVNYKKAICATYLHLGNRLLDVNSLQLDGYDIVNLAFVVPNNEKIETLNSNQAKNFKLLPKIKQRFPNTSFLISIGGYGTEERFAKMADNDVVLDIFVKNAVKFVKFYGFDGIDIDWEYPGMSNYDKTSDKVNFTKLLKKLRTALNEQSKKDKKKYLLTIASGAFPAYLNYTQMDICQQYLDYIFLMTYDFVGQWCKYTGHHTNLYATSTKPNAVTTHRMVNLYINKGVPKYKLVIGCAYYGRLWNNAEAKNNGLHSKAKGVGSISFRKISNLIEEDPDCQKFWDKDAYAPYIFNKRTHDFITFDDENSIFYKGQYVKFHHLGGIMSWEYFSDNELFSLSNALVNSIKSQQLFPKMFFSNKRMLEKNIR